MVRGLSEAAAARLEDARSLRTFPDLREMAIRARLNKLNPACLADAGALAAFLSIDAKLGGRWPEWTCRPLY